MARYLWMLVGLAFMSTLLYSPLLLSLQFKAWMYCVELFRPHVLGFVLSAAYFPLLLALTAWYWVWRFMRWIFEDEGPLPRFRLLLFGLWLPCTTIPLLLVFCFCAWIGCWSKALTSKEGTNE